MSNWKNFGTQGRSDFGVGVSIAPEDIPANYEIQPFETWIGGLNMADAPEDLDLGYGIICLDMEVTRDDRLIRAPGISEVSNEPHSLQYIFQQSSLDYSVELVAIDPPWLGYKGAGAWTWVNLGLGSTGLFGWNSINYLGDLLFSNGVDKTYSRAPGAAVVTDRSANVIARTFAQQFGRIFAGNYVTGGAGRALGILWNDTTGSIAGWAGTGSGNEPLLPPDGTADYIVALRTLGFDFVAILCRNSLWAGYPTGRSARPADFRFRFGGIGCVHERTARVTPGGITFLSDEGVVNYDVNSANVISGQINPELLPLDYFNLPKYTAAYSASRRRYYLQTPNALYIYEFPIPELRLPGRWFKRSTVVDSIIAFASQSALLTWDSLTGTWDAQTQSWDTMGLPGWAAPAAIFYALGTHFGQEDPAVSTWLGHNLTPTWRTPQVSRKMTTDQITTVGWEIIYNSSAVSQIKLSTMDKDGLYGTNSVTKNLPSTAGLNSRKIIWSSQTGMGLQTQIEVVSGSPQILRATQLYQPAGPVIGSVT